jgi:hydroxymethylpyrimidine/phosphomethylpyrimidine kinase
MPDTTGNSQSQTERPPVVLAIAGYDPISGAGIAADIKTLNAFGVYGTTTITSLVIQNTQNIIEHIVLTPAQVRSQLEAVLQDIPVDAVKIGVIPNEEIAREIVEAIEGHNLENVVLDPVLAASDGTSLSAGRIGAYPIRRLFGLCRLITPNIPEAEILSGITISNDDDRKRAAEKLCSGVHASAAVLIKGGHENADKSDDLLFDGNEFTFFHGTRRVIECHGTGCVLSSAIAAGLAAGQSTKTSIARAKEFIASMLADKCVKLGAGAALMNFDPANFSPFK